MRECGDCQECCIWLQQSAYGHNSGGGKPCAFLCSTGCSIYEKRPHTCSYYECAWKQGLFPDWMKPNECGVIISVQNLPNGKQYLNIIETEISLQNYILEEIEKFCTENDCGAIYKPKDGNTLIFKSEELVEYFSQ